MLLPSLTVVVTAGDQQQADEAIAGQLLAVHLDLGQGVDRVEPLTGPVQQPSAQLGDTPE